MRRIRAIRALCVAVLVAGAAIVAAPVASAESACVLDGLTPQMCNDKFLESIHSAFPVEKHDVAVNLGFEAVNLLLKHPNKKQFKRIVSDIMQANRDLSARAGGLLRPDGRALVRAAGVRGPDQCGDDGRLRVTDVAQAIVCATSN